MNFSDVTLSRLVFAGVMFNSLTPYNYSLSLFKIATGNSVDLTNAEHRIALLKWLNDWGCRHLPEKQHQVASQSILNWYQTHWSVLPNSQKPLWEFEEHEIETISNAYGSLKDRIGARRIRDGIESEVHIGATAASKILFAIMPKAIMPWDDAMRESYGCDGSPISYAGYLIMIRNLTFYIDTLCRRKGFQIGDLPEQIGRPKLTVLGLINEYIWITETRKVELPSSEILMKWAAFD